MCEIKSKQSTCGAYVPSDELRELREELVVAEGGDPPGHGVDGGEGDLELGAEVPHGGPRPLDGERLGAVGVLAPQLRALLLVRQPHPLRCLKEETNIFHFFQSEV